ncbi:MAG TPA: vitamin B12-dependent ribonucleotide reductase [Gaiellales bacterium]|nr:vitamin B12-dependent ribonucleotide reductase [Gaiellales bacterium]
MAMDVKHAETRVTQGREDVRIGVPRYFTTPETHPFDTVEWETRDALIPGKDGPSFEQKGVEFPTFWSQTATNIVAQKYFRGKLTSPERERSVKQMIGRVVDTITAWGRKDGYFADEEEAETFAAELTHILLHQMVAFNSPVWFNVGFEESPQCSACQPYRALISTPDGMVPIGELVDGEQIGREVYDSSGTTRVAAVKANGRKPVWRITLRNGSFVEATPDHVVKAVHERGTDPSWLRVDELRPGMRMHHYPNRMAAAERVAMAVAVGGGSTLDPMPTYQPDSDVREEEVVSIEPVGVEEVYDIQTESGEYLTNNVAVHNCFILSVEDSMESILDWIRKEGLVFRGGSGSGINLSKLRSSKEQLSKGGYASGPVSFMRGADASAGTIKSGGKTRRAAKMVVLNVDHPDIEEFIWCKQHEEEKARVLQAAGYDMSLDSPDWASIQYQNANNSVRVTDEFMRAVLDDEDWELTARTDGSVVKTVRARDLMHQIAEAAWKCADPGMHYDTTMNDWHTCPASGRINASNPCSEYLHVDNSACNLASLNLLQFRDPGSGEFKVEAFERAVDVIFMAQEILVGNSSYPTEEITRNAKAMRQLGLGFANLGALLMARGLAYDSDEGRAYAAAISAIMTGRAYRKSAEMASRVGAFDDYPPNADAMLRVIRKHRAAVGNIDGDLVPGEMRTAARQAWDEALALGEEHGYRNAQAVVIAPTGTISFMMDCDTTGIEPDFSLVKSKRLVGGGDITITNQTVPTALQRLGYAPHEIDQIVAHVNEHNTVVGAPGFKGEHLPVFDVAVGDRAIHYMGHVKMMAAVQPFVSGAISKTVNVPTEVTVDDIAQLYMDAWKMGVKAIAIYRDGCKVAQPLQTKGAEQLIAAKPTRRMMPIERQEIGRKFQVGEYEGYIHVGLFPEGDPGDIFVDIAKEGTTLAGLMNAFMIAVSVGMQYGVPLEVFVSKFAHMRFEPSGITNDPDIRIAKSIPDYIFRWMGKRFLDSETQAELGIMSQALREQLANGNGHASAPADPPAPNAGQTALFNAWEDAVECAKCGGRKVRTGACYTCRDCGDNSGCG